MWKERRRSERRPGNGLVQVLNSTGGPARECRLTDISEGGVRLYAENLALTDEFTLYLPSGENRCRRCRVIWRLGHEIGAAFADLEESCSERAPELVGQFAR
jgi:hypothetical protein